MSYTNQANIEANLGRSLTAGEITMLALHLVTVDGWIDNMLDDIGWNSTSEATRYYDGDTNTLDIDPCNTISAVKSVDTDETTVTDYDIDTDLEACPRNETVKTYIEKRNSKFPKGVRNIAVVAIFSRGATAPDDIVDLATYLISQFYQSGVKDGLKSEAIEGYRRDFGDFLNGLKENDPKVKMVLDKYTEDQILI